MLPLVKNSLVKKMKCEIVCCHDAAASCFVAKVRDEVFKHYHVVTICGIDCYGCQDEFCMNNLLHVLENGEHALGFALHLPHLFWSR
jgi:hypothetical protein